MILIWPCRKLIFYDVVIHLLYSFVNLNSNEVSVLRGLNHGSLTAVVEYTFSVVMPQSIRTGESSFLPFHFLHASTSCGILPIDIH